MIIRWCSSSRRPQGPRRSFTVKANPSPAPSATVARWRAKLNVSREQADELYQREQRKNRLRMFSFERKQLHVDLLYLPYYDLHMTYRYRCQMNLDGTWRQRYYDPSHTFCYRMYAGYRFARAIAESAVDTNEDWKEDSVYRRERLTYADFREWSASSSVDDAALSEAVAEQFYLLKAFRAQSMERVKACLDRSGQSYSSCTYQHDLDYSTTTHLIYIPIYYYRSGQPSISDQFINGVTGKTVSSSDVSPTKMAALVGSLQGSLCLLDFSARHLDLKEMVAVLDVMQFQGWQQTLSPILLTLLIVPYLNAIPGWISKKLAGWSRKKDQTLARTLDAHPQLQWKESNERLRRVSPSFFLKERAQTPSAEASFQEEKKAKREPPKHSDGTDSTNNEHIRRQQEQRREHLRKLRQTLLKERLATTFGSQQKTSPHPNPERKAASSLDSPPHPDPMGYYAFLGLRGRERQSTIDDIRQAFRKKSKEFHPDLHRSPESKLEATRQFQQLISVYTVLRDPVKRKEYDYTKKE